MKKLKILGSLSLAFMLTACGNSGNVDISPISVNYLELEDEQVQNYLDYNGYLMADEMKQYSFLQGGQIETINVEKGDTVYNGEVLATLDTDTLELARDSAEVDTQLAESSSSQLAISIENMEESLKAEQINLDKLYDSLDAENVNLKSIEDTYSSNITQLENSYSFQKEQLDNTELLYNQGIVSKTDYDTLKTQTENMEKELNNTKDSRDNDIDLQNIAIHNVETSIDAQLINIETVKNNIEAAKLQLNDVSSQIEQANMGVENYDLQIDYATLNSGIDGTVVEVTLTEGEITGAGTPVVIVKSDDDVVNIGVALDDFSKVYVGEEVLVSYNDEEISGTVSRVSAYPDEGTRTYDVEVSLEANDFHTGSLVNVKIPTDVDNGLFVPITSIFINDGVNYIYYINEQEDGTTIATKKEVQLGDVYEDKVLISGEGVEAGMKVITDNLRVINENDIVTVPVR